MKIQQWNPFAHRPTIAAFAPLQNEMNRLFEDFFRADPLRSITEYAPLDVLETDHEIKVMMDVPGLEAKDLKVSLSRDLLTIAGQRDSTKEEKGATWQRTERYHGAFERTLPLTATVDQEKVGAVFKNGVLTVTLEKSADNRSSVRRIDVRTA